MVFGVKGMIDGETSSDGCLPDRLGELAIGIEFINFQLGHKTTHLPVECFAIWTELKHIGEDGDPTSGGLEIGKECKSGSHRVGTGVIAVIEDTEAIREMKEL